jgi:hypothetical protein
MPDFLKALYGRVPCRPVFCSVSADPDQDTDGGGTGDTIDDSSTDDPGELLGPQGEKALKAARAEAKATAKEAEALKRQLAALKGAVSPEEFQAAKEAADQAQREAEAKGRELAQERERLSRKHQQELKAANERAMLAEQRATTKTIEFLTKESFYSAGGDNSVDEDGTSSFQAFMLLKGRKHLRLREDESVYVVDASGDELLDEKGKPVDVQTWITKQADGSPVLARLFKPRKGEGSGSMSSSGIRGVRGPDLHNMSYQQRMAAAWPDT